MNDPFSEPGEIEVALTEHPAVRECVVLAREDAPGDKWLAAYVVAAGQSIVSAEALRIFLKDKLPEYMIPSAIVRLEVFPLTPNGYIDRRGLSAPETAFPDTTRSYVAPREELEKELAEICAEALKLDKVGVHDNFFELGGHSFMATQVINRVRSQMGLELPLLTVFVSPTVAEIAQTIRSMSNS